jgi:hypothetical protein
MSMKGEGMKAGGMMKTNETDRRREIRKIFFAVALFSHSDLQLILRLAKPAKEPVRDRCIRGNRWAREWA